MFTFELIFFLDSGYLCGLVRSLCFCCGFLLLLRGRFFDRLAFCFLVEVALAKFGFFGDGLVHGHGFSFKSTFDFNSTFGVSSGLCLRFISFSINSGSIRFSRYLSFRGLLSLLSGLGVVLVISL